MRLASSYLVPTELQQLPQRQYRVPVPELALALAPFAPTSSWKAQGTWGELGLLLLCGGIP
jgi:hypothetical protein